MAAKTSLTVRQWLHQIYDSTLGAMKVSITNVLKGYETGPDAYKFVLGYRGGYKSYEDPTFVTGETGRILDVNNDLGRNAHRGYFANDGAGDIEIKIAVGDGTVLGDVITLKPDDSFPFDGMDIDNIELTWKANTAYRCVAR